MPDQVRSPGAGKTFEAVFVLGLEGEPTPDDYECVVQRLDRVVRPWDVVVPLDATTVGVRCTNLTSGRETDATAERLADLVRAPLAVGDDIRTFGVCVGAATRTSGETPDAAMRRAETAMRQMRERREGLLVPGARAAGDRSLVRPG